MNFTPYIARYYLRINVTDSLNLTESTTIEYQGKSDIYTGLSPCLVVCVNFSVGPLVLECFLNGMLEVTCTSSNQLAPNETVCFFNGDTTDPCMFYGANINVIVVCTAFVGVLKNY